MGVCPTIETERLLLRPFVEADLEPYWETLRHPDVAPWLHLTTDVSRDEAWEQMAVFAGQWSLRGSGQWALESRETGEFLGRAGPHRPERVGWPGVEVGWTLHPDHWGNGYATEAGSAAIDYAFANLEIDEVFSLILPQNAGSQRVARRLGMSLRDQTTLPFTGTQELGIWSRRA